MGKKRKVSARADTKVTNSDFNEKDGKLGPINTFEDVADSEDEFHIQRDKVLLDDGPDAKRRRKWQEQDAFLEPSDEEVLGYSSASEEDDANEDEQDAANDSSDENADEEEDEDVGGWGSSRKDYYGHDAIETEQDALEEERELKRLQEKRLQRLSEADFGFEESEWLDAGEDQDDGDVVVEVLKDIEITPEMGPQERLRILQTRYPEFESLANEFTQLRPVLQSLQQKAELEIASREDFLAPSTSTIIRCRALAAYVSALAMYFAILTSPAMGPDSQAKTLDPLELRDHSVMESLLQCRELWLKVKSLKSLAPDNSAGEGNLMSEEDVPESDGDHPTPQNETIKPSKKSKTDRAREAAASAAAATRAEYVRETERGLADLEALVARPRKSAKRAKDAVAAGEDSDFGEEAYMDAKAAVEKEKKKKSLRFYTSQIAQKANKRAGAGREAGGDMDVPHRERLRDRQARLNAEAEKRGKKLDEYGRGAALGDSNDEDEAVKNDAGDDEDEYYDIVAKTSKKRKDDKNERYDAIVKAKAENKMVRVVEGEVDEDGKRAIGYVIEKNKGLAPRRKKDVRNPRVKKRKKFEEKKKKLGSMRAVYKGGEERGGYGGEKTGIKADLVKSVKL